jgi:hypothetical protein
MPRRVIWIEKQNFQGFGCSGCDWRFEASGMPEGNSLEEMERKFKEQRDKEFRKHICSSQITNSRAN